jgi:hypothetical protein
MLVVIPSALKAAGGQHSSSSALPKICIAPDGRTFLTESGKPFVPTGLTYYRPGTGWAPQVWKKFDAEATRQDFLRMKALGVNCVRVFLSGHASSKPWEPCWPAGPCLPPASARARRSIGTVA